MARTKKNVLAAAKKAADKFQRELAKLERKSVKSATKSATKKAKGTKKAKAKPKKPKKTSTKKTTTLATTTKAKATQSATQHTKEPTWVMASPDGSFQKLDVVPGAYGDYIADTLFPFSHATFGVAGAAREHSDAVLKKLMQKSHRANAGVNGSFHAYPIAPNDPDEDCVQKRRRTMPPMHTIPNAD